MNLQDSNKSSKNLPNTKDNLQSKPSDSPNDNDSSIQPSSIATPKENNLQMSSLTRRLLFSYFVIIILSSGVLLIYGLDYHFCANVFIKKTLSGNENKDNTVNKSFDSSLINCTKFGTKKISTVLTNVEGWYALIAAMFGALGGAVHGLSSLITWRGTNKLDASWTQWYIARPLIGSAISFIIYVIVRAGYFDSSAVINDGSLPISIYGIAAIGALVGFMSSAATQKLKDVFDIVFGIQKPNKERGDVPKQDLETEISIEEKIEIIIEEIKDINVRFTNSLKIPQKNTPVTFILQNNNIAAFVNKEDNIIVKNTDSLGMVNIQLKGLSEGKTILAVVTKVGENVDNKTKLNDVAKSIEIIVKNKVA